MLREYRHVTPQITQNNQLNISRVLLSTFRELWHKENTLKQKLSSLKENWAEVDRKFRYVVYGQIQKGIESVRKVLDTFRRRGGQEAEIGDHYYGLVIDNFDCNEELCTAVEVTASERLVTNLFHI